MATESSGKHNSFVKQAYSRSSGRSWGTKGLSVRQLLTWKGFFAICDKRTGPLNRYCYSDRGLTILHPSRYIHIYAKSIEAFNSCNLKILSDYLLILRHKNLPSNVWRMKNQNRNISRIVCFRGRAVGYDKLQFLCGNEYIFNLQKILYKYLFAPGDFVRNTFLCSDS